MPISVGDKLGPYEILAPIGAGGMGEVWKAFDTRLDRIVAIKIFKGQHGERFRQEARAIAALNHPHICQVYDVGADYLVLEYIEGQRLPCPMTPDETARVALEIADAIEAAHQKGIIHRDLKPANIMLTQDRSVKLLDFGLAKLMASENTDDTHTLEGVVVGTIAYMSPEQAEGKALDERSDVFSFGAVLYEMLTGSSAFGGGPTTQIISAILHGEPPPFQAPPAFDRIVRRCLAKRPADRFQNTAELRAALQQLVAKPPDKRPSIAVLPFSIMSGDKEDEYFSDGLAEEIINALAHIPGLNVTARTSSFAFRGKQQDIRKIAEMLDVATILEGSMRRAGSRIRVTAQLIDAANGYHLWSERYDREIADVFAMQDEIANAIALALKVKFSVQPDMPRRYTPGLPAYEFFLKARYFLRKFSAEAVARGRECLEQAIALDPNFALAHAEMAAYFRNLSVLVNAPALEALPQARRAAQQALRVDHSLPEAHAELATVALFLDHDWEMAGRHFQLAMAHEPIPATVSHSYGFFYLLPLGRIREATEELERALKEDPLNVLCRTQLAVCHWTEGRNELAAREFRQALELDEHFWLALLVYSMWHALEGSVEQLLALAERAYAIAPRNPDSIGLLAGALSRIGETQKAERLLRELGDAMAYGAPLGMSIYHNSRWEFDQAADWLEKAIEQRDPNTLPASCGPNRSHYVANGRWPALARLLNLPETATGQPG
jgi:TolB-like protein/Tfp pilus assembly protein PilF/predicted Ser/Thr protein kinase